MELKPATEAGGKMQRAAAAHASALREHAALHDREARYPAAEVAAMQMSGFLASCVPEGYGGLGVERASDVAAALTTLARGDGGTALGANMHLMTSLGMARLVAQAEASGGDAPAWIVDILKRIGAGEALICVAGTEPGQTIGWFQSAGRPTSGGYSVSGHKIFCTNAPSATHLYVMFRIPAPDGAWLNAVTVIDADAEGVSFVDNWDSMGMRSSGSHAFSLCDVRVPADRVLPVGRPREMSRYWIRFFSEGNIGLLATFVGIAEEAFELALEKTGTATSTTTGRSIVTRNGVQRYAAEIAQQLAVARACVERAAMTVDAFYAADEIEVASVTAHHRMMAEFQALRLASQQACIRAVDAAMTLVGGSSYMSGSRLSQLYRDVRAGPFMQAYSPIEAEEYIGKIVLGMEPDLSE